MKQITLSPLENPVTKVIEIPGSKSYTNRALLMASLTKNPVIIKNPLISEDTWAMIGCLKLLGIAIELDENAIIVKGSFKDVREGSYQLNANLAATTMRFILPLLCVIPGIKILTGNEGLNKRPIEELVNALRQLDAKIEYLEKEGYPPLKITSSKLNPHAVHMKGNISSQFFSALFMIAPIIDGFTIHVDGKQISKPYIDMTIDTMSHFGITVKNAHYKTYRISSGQKYDCETYSVEGDFSSAGYFFAIAAATQSKITLKNLNPKSLQADKKLLPILEKMGNEIIIDNNTITIVGKEIKPVTVNMIDFPDQAQTLAVLTAFAKGKSVLTGLESLHVKETDRLKATVSELAKMGIKTESTHDTLTIFGGNPQSASIDTYGDQRTAMSFAIAGFKLSNMIINDPDVVNKTFPNFWDMLEEVGMKWNGVAR
ncbi:MAG TPA: 3-phosphoshikimate 1-carboxyvinyltransferase [Candidatus Sulfotelmatobacter sp.]|jgi:3-phosphoshikimate 1-carboxyvinyltransferase|nr:3-phosphoshikimate 1-carboxyvinyltransferase [Candidatus Sulfotelmatobacter sp.]